MMAIPTALAHISGQSAVITDGHDHELETAVQAHPAIVALVVLPAFLLFVGILTLIFWTAIHFTKQKYKKKHPSS